MPVQATSHKILDSETYSRILRKSGNKKWWVFERNWQLVIWYASRLATTSSLSKSSRWLKTQISRPWYFETIFDWCLRACWPKFIHFQEHFWVIILSLDKNDINDFGPKLPSFQSYPHTEKWFFNLKGPLWHVSLPGVNESKKKWKKNKRKNDCHVMHLKNSIKPKWESRRSKNAKKKWWKIA